MDEGLDDDVQEDKAMADEVIAAPTPEDHVVTPESDSDVKI